MVIQRLHDFLDRTNDELILVVTVAIHQEVQLHPLLLDLLHLGLDTTLTRCSGRNFFNSLSPILNTVAQQLREAH